jgi:hypothetical protein
MTMTKWSIMFTAMMAFYSENLTKHTNMDKIIQTFFNIKASILKVET